jgi:hypothetical protein
MTPTEVIARTIYFEDARHPETPADSIWNRASRRAVSYDFRSAQATYKRASALVNVVMDAKQYSCWNSGKLWTRPIPGDAASRRAWARALELADSMVMGVYQPTSRTTHYAVIGINPRWARGMKPLGIVGRHERWVGV